MRHICVGNLTIIGSDNGLVPSHYLNQCWNIKWALRNKLQWNFIWNSYIFIQENALENDGHFVSASVFWFISLSFTVPNGRHVGGHFLWPWPMTLTFRVSRATSTDKPEPAPSSQTAAQLQAQAKLVRSEAWMSNYTPLFYMEVIAYPCKCRPNWSEPRQCWGLSIHLDCVWISNYIQGVLWYVITILIHAITRYFDASIEQDYGISNAFWAFLRTINSLWPSNAIWRHRSGSTQAQVMACCLTAPSHYLNQCWLFINLVQ